MKNLDKIYRDSIKATYDYLKKSYQDILNNYEFDLDKTDVSEAILERLKTYYETQNTTKTFLGKRYLTAGADYFVETTLFFLRIYLQSQGGELQAHSERQIKQKRGAIRPDISIWRQNEVIAIIECKTQLGWNRYNWEQDFNEREKKLKIEFPNAKAFLLVMSGLNWGGFSNNKELNSKYFCLLANIWPPDYSSINQLMTPVEGLFKQLKY